MISAAKDALSTRRLSDVLALETAARTTIPIPSLEMRLILSSARVITPASRRASAKASPEPVDPHAVMQTPHAPLVGATMPAVSCQEGEQVIAAVAVGALAAVLAPLRRLTPAISCLGVYAALALLRMAA